MPSVKQYQGLRLAGFPDGLNRHADSSRLEDTEVPESLNFRMGPRGEMQMRTGYTRHDLNLANVIDWVFNYRSLTPTDHLIVVDDTGQIFEDELDGTFNDSTKTTNPTNNLQQLGVGFAAADGFAYVTGKDMTNTTKFDGTVWADVAGISPSKHLQFRHGRMFAINQNATPSRIEFSGFLQPESFAAEDFIDVDPDDGYQINATTIFGDDLILIKDKSLHKLAGRTPESFALYEVDTHRGCVSPRSLAQIRGLLVFYDRDTGVWAFNGASFELLSQNINDYILANADYDNAYLASAYVGIDRYYLSIPWAGGGYRTFVYFADTGGWSEYNTGFNHATFYLGNRYQGHPGAAGVYVADPLSNLFAPDIAPLLGRFRTPWLRVGGEGSKARIRRIEMVIKAAPTVDFTVRMYRDFDPDTVYVTRDFTGGAVPYLAVLAADTEERVVTSDGWGNRVHAIQFEFETEETPFQLNELTIFFTGGIDVRGDR